MLSGKEADDKPSKASLYTAVVVIPGASYTVSGSGCLMKRHVMSSGGSHGVSTRLLGTFTM